MLTEKWMRKPWGDVVSVPDGNIIVQPYMPADVDRHTVMTRMAVIALLPDFVRAAKAALSDYEKRGEGATLNAVTIYTLLRKAGF